jgi:hypothetical protein
MKSLTCRSGKVVSAGNSGGDNPKGNERDFS